jgi:hypothetical protein
MESFLPHHLELLGRPVLGLSRGELTTEEEGELALLDLTLRAHSGDEHRIRSLQTVESDQGFAPSASC